MDFRFAPNLEFQVTATEARAARLWPTSKPTGLKKDAGKK